MNDIKLRNTAIAAICIALTSISLGVVQANSMPTTSKPPVKTTPVTPGATPAPATADTPATPGNIVELAASSSQFSKLVAAVKAAELVEALSSTGPYTLFAPNDKAFAKLPVGTLEKLLKPANKAELQRVLKYHVIAGAVLAADVKTSKVPTAEGGSLKLVAGQGTVTVNGAKVIKADNKASNGVVHVIDTVLIPANLKLK